MAKRRQGEGSISQRPDGTYWGRITIGKTFDGKQKRKAFYGKTRAEVEEKMNIALKELKEDNKKDFEQSDLTLAKWLDIWFAEYVNKNIKHSTRVSYDTYIYKHITPIIGHIKLVDLEKDILQSFYNYKLEKGKLDGNGGLSSKTVKSIHFMLHKSLEEAFEKGLIKSNVSKNIIIPKGTKKEIHVLSLEEQKRLLETSKEHKHGLVISIALATGMRIGEIVGLKWSDINFENNSLTVNRTLNRLKNYDESIKSKTIIVESEPKTKKGIRTIPIPDNIIKELEKLKKYQKKMMMIEPAYENGNYVFTNQFGKPLEPRYVQSIFKNSLLKAQIDDTNFHSLRHTFATRALEASVPAKIVSEILGHSNISVTLDLYSHVSFDTKRDAINKIQNFVLE